MAASDEARKWTDAELGSLERRMRREYEQAAREMRGKQAKWLEKFNHEREMREKALDDTPEAMEAHKRWLQSQTARSEWFDAMVDGLSDSAHQANRRAVDMANGHLPHVYSENANRAAFAVDKAIRADTGFTLVNEDAVRYLMGVGETGGQLIREVVSTVPQQGPGAIQEVRRRVLDDAKDIRWNRQKFTSAITQGILQGESIPNIVKRTESIFGSNRDAAIRAARTATTNAENAGRMSSFERAQRLGIDLEIEWVATLDGRTRSAHRELDGQKVKTGEWFENSIGKIRYPGDPQADGANTWNCRCAAEANVVGFDGKRGDWADDVSERWSRLPEGMTYEQWKAGKAVSRAESYQNEAGRVSSQWLGAENPMFTNGLQSDIIDSVSVMSTQLQASGISQDHAGEIAVIVERADEVTASVYRAALGELKMDDMASAAAHYSPSTHGLTLDMDAAARGFAARPDKAPYQTFFHEYAHYVDHRMTGFASRVARRGRSDIRIATHASYDAGLHNVARREVSGWVNAIEERHMADVSTDPMFNSFDFLVKEEVEHRTKAELMGLFRALNSDGTIGGLADIVHGATRGKYGYGHSSRGYWTGEIGKEHLATETFAHFFECEMANPAALETLKARLPKTYEAYRSIIEGTA